MKCLEVGDPLTAEELEEKERLLEEVCGFYYLSGVPLSFLYLKLVWFVGKYRDFHHGAEGILILSLEHVKSMAEMI